MPTNTLIPAAAQVVPVEPTTKFFDPSASLGIMQRYGMSGQSRAFAEDALKSANEIDKSANYDPINRRDDLERHGWNREVKDKADLAYEEKKDFESTLGTYLVDFAKLDENADDFDEKLAALTADPRALDNEAVKAIYNVKVGQREQMSRQKLQKMDYEKRLTDEFVGMGINPADITGDDGTVDRLKVASLISGKNAAKLQAEAAENDREGKLKFYNGDKDVVDASTAEQVEPLYKTRRKVFLESGAPLAVSTESTEGKPSEFDTLISEAPALTADAFVARLMKYDASASGSLEGITDPTERIVKIMAGGKDTRDPKLMPMVKSAMDLFNAAHARGRVAPSATKLKDSTPAAPARKRNPTANAYFDE